MKNSPNSNRGVQTPAKMKGNAMITPVLTIQQREKLLEFCCKTANTPLIIEEWYPIGQFSIGIEGLYNPNDGNILDLMQIAFARYFHGFRAQVNIVPDDDGFHKYSARMTARATAKQS